VLGNGAGRFAARGGGVPALAPRTAAPVRPGRESLSLAPCLGLRLAYPRRHPPGDVEFALYEGTVGRGAAIEFTGFLRVFRSLPSLDGILLNPGTAPIPNEPSALCAVATGLARRTT
jgi:hypothetical protein